jgi:hypothetical protein
MNRLEVCSEGAGSLYINALNAAEPIVLTVGKIMGMSVQGVVQMNRRRLVKSVFNSVPCTVVIE